MITILIYGLDQFVVGRLSRELSPNLAEIYETSEDNFEFIAPDTIIFHKGVEQTSWDVFVEIKAPKRYALVEEFVAKFLLDQISYFAINVHLEFSYYDEERTYERINNEYPRFITEENIVNVDDSEYSDNIDEDGEYSEDDLYTGDIFKDFNGK